MALALLACVGLAACTSAEAQPPASTAETSTVAVMPENGDLDAGTYLATGFTVPFEITVPDGWNVNDGFLLEKEPGADGRGVFVMFSNPSYVPADACGRSGELTEVEPSVEAFADGLAAAASTTTTAPIDVKVGDFRGVEFDLTVENDVDINDCSSAQVCIHSEAPTHCTRYYQTLAERETYRVLDLHGERAVMAVGQWEDDVDPALVKEARAVFDSIEFAPAE